MHLPLPAVAFAIVVVLPGGPARAQNTVVSPVGSATSEGTSANVFPFTSSVVRRYQQIHADIGPPPRVIQKLAFRLNATTSNYTGVWAMDLELFMGHARSFEGTSHFFDRNYFLPKTNVIPRTIVNWGPQGQGVTPGPVPFSPGMVLMPVQPFVFIGAFPLVWEVVMYSNTPVGAGTLDADAATSSAVSQRVTGSGCAVAGMNGPMAHAIQGYDHAGWFACNVTVTNAPPSTPVVLALGTTNPAWAVPGLCSSVYTDLALLVPIGSTLANGSITLNEAGAATFFWKNLFPNATLFTQVHAPDANRVDPIRLANSDGRQFTIPVPNLTRVLECARVFNNSGGVTATEGFFTSSSYGYALPVQFSY